jgi:quercetin dioxygenase-like cupin family protein
MHVSPSDLRMVRQDGLVIRFALLGSMAFVMVEVPTTGSAGTSIEVPCVKPHWAFVISGDVTYQRDGRTQPILPGSAFHVPAGGAQHWFRASGNARIAGFEPIDPVADTSDSALAAQGFELLGPEVLGSATVIPGAAAPLLDDRQINARAWSMSALAITQANFGPGSGYTTTWCDAPHWGLVTGGRLAIEWEDDVEILAVGDVYHCPAGPPGHRLEAADPASIVDLTPVGAFSGGTRMAKWRQQPEPSAPSTAELEPIWVAGLG